MSLTKTLLIPEVDTGLIQPYLPEGENWQTVGMAVLRNAVQQYADEKLADKIVEPRGCGIKVKLMPDGLLQLIRDNERYRHELMCISAIDRILEHGYQCPPLWAPDKVKIFFCLVHIDDQLYRVNIGLGTKKNKVWLMDYRTHGGLTFSGKTDNYIASD